MASFENKSTQTESEKVLFSHKCTQTENKVVPSETLNTELKEDIEEATSSPVQTAPFSAKINSSDHHWRIIISVDQTKS